MSLEFSRCNFEKYVSYFIDIRPVGGKLLHADRQTDMAKLIDASRNFANAPKMNKKHANLLNQSRRGTHHIMQCINLHLHYKGWLVYTLSGLKGKPRFITNARFWNVEQIEYKIDAVGPCL